MLTGLDATDEFDALQCTFNSTKDWTGPLNYYRANWKLRKPIASIPDIKVPTIIIWDPIDPILKTRNAEFARKYVKGSA